MGIAVVVFLLIVFLFSVAVLSHKKWWIRLISVVLGLAMFFGLVGFIAIDPFSVTKGTEIETVNLSSYSADDIIQQKEEEWQLNDKKVNIEVDYKLSDLPDGCIYLFVDESNKIYYVEEDSVTVAIFNSFGRIDTDKIYSYTAEIVKGDYESVYAEKYVTTSKITFLSVGIRSNCEYKFYIPEDIAGQY